MASSSGIRTQPPQAFISTYAPRIRTYGNALLGPAIQPQNTAPQVRTTKRGTTAINYADDAFDDDDFDDSEGPRRHTGLRSLKRDETGAERPSQGGRNQKELDGPVEVQGIWRDWIGKPSKLITEKQHQVQCSLPLTLIPIKIDLDIPSFRPEAPLPAPSNARDFGIDESLPAYRPGEPTPPYSLKDTFLWNLHEALMTPDQFARRFVEEMDFPHDRKPALIMQITNQIRSQLEEHASVALHPLFQSTAPSAWNTGNAVASGLVNGVPQSRPGLPTGSSFNMLNGTGGLAGNTPGITAGAEMIQQSSTEDILNPDDAYRCIINLNVNLRNKLYSDKFEWSLVHPPGAAEQFARQTCADLGLGSEWVAALSHAIYEAVLKLRREVCENGTLGTGDIDNEAALAEGAGWRYDPETLGVQWEPSLEELTKEEIEKREYDRERQMRRARRETARFTNIAPPAPQNDFFAVQDQDQPLGRGERRKTKRRFRSLSPTGRETPDANVQGYTGASSLRDDERQYWRCSHCQVWGSAVWAVRDGPNGPRTLCHNCGLLLERDKRLPPWSKDFFATDLHQMQRR